RPTSARDLASEFHDALMMTQSGPLPEEYRRPPTPTAVPAAPETVVAAENPTPVTYDPNSVSYRMEAWMPDAIASHKLRGFVHDHAGEVIESVPGKIRVRIGSNPSAA